MRQPSQLSSDFNSQYLFISLSRFLTSAAEAAQSLSNSGMVRVLSDWSTSSYLKIQRLLSKLVTMTDRQPSRTKQYDNTGSASLQQLVTLLLISVFLKDLRQLQQAMPQFLSSLALKAISPIDRRQLRVPPASPDSTSKSWSVRNRSRISSSHMNFEFRRTLSISSSLFCRSSRKASSRPHIQERFDLIPSFGGSSGSMNPQKRLLRYFMRFSNSVYLLQTAFS